MSGAALVLAILATYGASLNGDFLWDDDSHVTKNPCIVGPLGLREIWTTPAANYFPLVLTNFWIQHALWGLNPLGYHLVTVGFHAVAALLLWRLLAALRMPGAWVGAALWSLHPVQAESVAWISELKNTQSAVFFLLSVAAYVRAVESAASARWHYLGALGTAVLALLSKPSTVMLPVVLCLVHGWLGCPWRRRDVLRLAPFFLFSALAAGWAIWEQRHHSGALGAEWAHGGVERLAIAVRAIGFYLGKLIWPQPLMFIYPRWENEELLRAAFLAVIVLLLVAVGWWLVHARVKALRGMGMAALFFLALLFPVLGFFDVYFFRYSFVGDHFQYLASMGPLAGVGAGLAALPRARVAVAALVLVASGILTWRHTTAFANSETLWRTTLAKNPGAPVAWLNLGATLAEQRRHVEAIACFERVATLRPSDAEAQNDTGWFLQRAGYAEQALPFLHRALQLQPELASAHTTLGNALRTLGRRDEALAHYLRVCELQPESAEACNNAGSALAEAGRTAQAIRYFQDAVQRAPDFVPAQANLGTALGLAGRWPEAITALRAAVRRDPNYPDAQAKLAVALANTERREESLPHFRAAVKLAPAAIEVRRNYGAVLEALGRHDEAREQFAVAGSGVAPKQ